MTPIQRFARFMTPFLVVGIAIAFAVGLLVVLSYVLVWGLAIAGILALCTYIKQKLQHNNPNRIKRPAASGRIIEHDE